MKAFGAFEKSRFTNKCPAPGKNKNTKTDTRKSVPGGQHVAFVNLHMRHYIIAI
jgi:hypothetical protein